MKAIVEGMTFPFTIPQGFRITPEQFEQLAEVEQLARLELTEHGELIVMSRRAYAQRVLCTRPLRGQGAALLRLTVRSTALEAYASAPRVVRRLAMLTHCAGAKQDRRTLIYISI